MIPGSAANLDHGALVPLRLSLGKYSPRQLFSRWYLEGSVVSDTLLSNEFALLYLWTSQWVESGLQKHLSYFFRQSLNFLLPGMNIFNNSDTSQTNAVHYLNWLCTFCLAKMHICIFFCPVFCSFSLSLYILLNKASNNCSTARVLYCLKTPSTKQLSSLVFNLASFMFSGHKTWTNPLPTITWMFYSPVDNKVLLSPEMKWTQSLMSAFLLAF